MGSRPASSSADSDSHAEQPHAWASSSKLIFAGSLSLLLYLVIAWLSFQFDEPPTPLLATVGLFVASFFLYLWAIRVAVKGCFAGSPGKALLRIILGFALAFRAVLLFSEPIQEVDIYRYLWDGLVSNQGVSPFEYPPLVVAECQVLPDTPNSLRRLVEVRDASQGIRETLDRVHFAYLPTVYPPVSQVVFSATAFVTPINATLRTRVRLMKAVLLLFDVGTIFLIAKMLQLVGRSPGWLIAYAWCPLVLKEFANSGHLDSIAVFLSALAVWLATRVLFASKPGELWSRLQVGTLAAAGGILGLAVGAKLYPVVLVPLLAMSGLRRHVVATLLAASLFSAVTLVSLWPVLKGPTAEATQSNLDSPPVNPFEEDAFAVEEDAFAAEPSDPRAGFQAFFSQWMMNDLIFLTTAENLTPDTLRSPQDPRPWFVVTSETFRQGVVDTWSTPQAVGPPGIGPPEVKAPEVAEPDAATGLQPAQVPFTVARAITAAIFSIVALALAWRASKTHDPSRWLELVFLTLAWFWLLLPTLNPWYWIWALPWVGFCRNRVWLWMSGILFAYYLRFYFETLDPSAPILGSGYGGVWFFDYVGVWVEYVPWFVCLAVQAWFLRREREITLPDTFV